jgi:hypothetical protein
VPPWYPDHEMRPRSSRSESKRPRARRCCIGRQACWQDIEAAPKRIEIRPDFDVQRAGQFVSLDRYDDIARTCVLDFHHNVEFEPRIDALTQSRELIPRPVDTCLGVEEIVAHFNFPSRIADRPRVSRGEGAICP